jgi:hypothetical protein
LHYSKFGTCYLLFLCHLPPRTFFKFSNIVFSFFLSLLLFNFSISKSVLFYSYINFLFLVFLIVGLQRTWYWLPWNGKHRQCDRLAWRSSMSALTHIHTHMHTNICSKSALRQIKLKLYTDWRTSQVIVPRLIYDKKMPRSKFQKSCVQLYVLFHRIHFLQHFKRRITKMSVN